MSLTSRMNKPIKSFRQAYAGGGHYLSRLFARYDEAGTGKG